MADSGALRARRARRHKAGDHSLCASRCAARGGVAAASVAGDCPVDARASLEALARRLEAASEADPGDAAVARELRATLLVLPARGAAEVDPLAELAALAADLP